MKRYKYTKGLFLRYFKDLPIFYLLYKYYTEYKLRHRLIKNTASSEFIFTSVYQNNSWNNSESISGVGSTVLHTRKIISELPAFLEKFNVNSILDAPCGDFNWMKYVNLGSISYLGADVVKELVDQNNAKYRSSNVRFINLDICKDPLPSVDLIFVRDCLVHFDYLSINLFIKNLLNSDIRFILITNFPITTNNYDITMGNFRFLNLKARPFFFPDELDILWEESIESNGQCPDKSLFLWSVDDVRKKFQ